MSDGSPGKSYRSVRAPERHDGAPPTAAHRLRGVAPLRLYLLFQTNVSSRYFDYTETDNVIELFEKKLIDDNTSFFFSSYL